MGKEEDADIWSRLCGEELSSSRYHTDVIFFIDSSLEKQSILCKLTEQHQMTQYLGFCAVQGAEMVNDLNFIYTPAEWPFKVDDSMQKACWYLFECVMFFNRADVIPIFSSKLINILWEATLKKKKKAYNKEIQLT